MDPNVQQPVVEPKGSTLLKVVSILMIIGGIIGAVGSLIMALVAGAASVAVQDAEVQASIAEAGTTAGTVQTILWVSTIIMIISAVIEIIAGVKGKKNWNNPAMAKTLIIWGVVCAVISVIGNIISATGDGVSPLTIITGLVIPILYIIGAVQLKNQA